MVKLTADLVYSSPQYINACSDRELCLRGYRIPVIENLGATFDQYHCIDFSDNDIRRLEGFPYLKNLTVLLLNNNSIVSISDSLYSCLPNLEILVLTGNLIANCSQLNALSSFKYLRILSLLGNPVTKLPYYRAYVTHHIPQLKVLDFRKIKMKERLEARKFFSSKEGKEIKQTINKAMKEESKKKMAKNKDFSTVEMSKIMAAIDSASTLDQIDKLHDLLLAGKVPGNDYNGIQDNADISGDKNGERISITGEESDVVRENKVYPQDLPRGEEYQENDEDYPMDGEYTEHGGYRENVVYPEGGDYAGEGDYIGEGDYQGELYQSEETYQGEDTYGGDGVYEGEGDYEAAYQGDGIYHGEEGYQGDGTYQGDDGYQADEAYAEDGTYQEGGAYTEEGVYSEDVAYSGEAPYVEENEQYLTNSEAYPREDDIYPGGDEAYQQENEVYKRQDETQH